MLDSDSSDDLMSGASRGPMVIEDGNHEYFSCVNCSVIGVGFHTVGVVDDFSRGFKVADRVSFLVG